MKSLIIVESPTKIDKISKLLKSSKDEYVALASYGHICDLAKGGQYGIGIDIKNNFKPTYLLMKDKITVLQNIIDAAQKSDQIILLTDGDFEGESIAHHISRYLKSSGKKILRGVLKEITEKGIKDCFNSLSEIDMNVVYAQETRRILDRIVGFIVSPYLCNEYQKDKFGGLSAGRVQSVVVRMICDQESTIQSFKAEEYWNIFANFSTQNNKIFSTKLNNKINNKKDAEEIVNIIKEKNDFYVSSIENKDEKVKPQPPMTTASLQQIMARKFSMSPEETMSSAQTLYENGYCTYIRTDSVRAADEAIDNARDWMKKNNLSYPKKPNVYKTKSSAQDAHECIRPSNLSNNPNEALSMSKNDKEVYKIIWQYFVASQMNPAIWSTLKVKISSKSNSKISFYASGKVLKEKGYLEIFGDIDEGRIDIPNLSKDEELKITGNIKSEQKFTQPPPRYNDAILIKELENRQIGRPSTFAEIIKKISGRNYVEKQGATYRPTELGKKITKVLTDNFSFLDYNFTANLEDLLDKIAAGETSRDKVLKDFFASFNDDMIKITSKNNNSKLKCKKCNNIMNERDGKFGRFSMCINNLCRYTEKNLVE